MKRIVNAMYFVFIITLLGGCGGGNGGSNVPTVSGVAASGAPLVGTVTLKDSSSTPKELSASLASDGSFSFDVTRLAAPFLLQASGTAGGNNYTLYSLSSTGGNCNINPLTNLAVTMANGGQDPSDVFIAPTPAKITAISATLPAAVDSIHDKLAPMFNQVEASPVNVLTDQFAANGQGLDLLFDLVSITVGNGSVSMVNKEDGGTILSAASIASGVLTDSPNVDAMSPVFSITSHSFGGIVSAQSKAPPYPSTPLMTVKADTLGNYRLFAPNGAYEVCSFDPASLKCLDVTVSNANVTELDFPVASIIPKEEQVPFQTVERGGVSYSQIEGGIHVLRSTTEWSNFWNMLKRSSFHQLPPPSVNFSENTVIAVVDIHQTTGGYSITITDVQKSLTGVEVHAVHQSPGPNCVVTASITQPYHIIKTPVFPGEATLNLTETVYACPPLF